MNFKKYHVSKNLFNRATDILGYRLGKNGMPFPDSAYEVSEFIAITPNTYISRSENFTTNRPLCEYDAEKNHIKRTTRGSSVLLTNNTYYVRTAVERTDVDIMLNTGSTPLPYEPYDSEVWHNTPHYIHNTSTDTITTLPDVVYVNDTTATVGLKGNLSQSGTPSPTTPIQPSECGERTGNLFDEQYPGIKRDTPTYRPIYVGSGTFTLSTSTTRDTSGADLFLLSGNVRSGANTTNNGVWNGRPYTVESADGYVTIAYRYYYDTSSDPRYNTVMLNTGSTSKPYEPYGYKIPISSANTTTPVYLGEVETTRKVKKYECTGDENWKKSTTYQGSFYAAILDNAMLTRVLCTHAEYVSPISAQTYVYGKCGVDGGASTKNINLFIGESSWTVDDFKAYIAQQYAAGTPVTVWYVLATEETGIVNEPIRKIGDYADEVSGITIPTIAGANTISVGTTLQPSEVTVNYKGWHPVQSVHERENGAWT